MADKSSYELNRRETETETGKEIAVTDEMLSAGMSIVDEYYAGDGRYLVSDEMLERLFMAMIVKVPR